MSLQYSRVTEAIPEETARVARAAFPKGSVALWMCDHLGAFVRDLDLDRVYLLRGRPVEAPWRLVLVTVLQYIEGLSDRQAAEAVRARIDWTDALGMEVTDPGFDYSLLSEFRARLIGDEVGLGWEGGMCQNSEFSRANRCWRGLKCKFFFEFRGLLALVLRRMIP